MCLNLFQTGGIVSDAFVDKLEQGRETGDSTG